MPAEKMLVWTGNVTLERVLPSDAEGDHLESTIAGRIEGLGSLAGFRGQAAATFDSILRPDGSRRGIGQALVRGDNGEVVTVKGEGMAQLIQGRLVYRAVHTFGSKTEGLTWLNSIVGCSEYEQDDDGRFVFTIYHWK